MNEKFQKKGGDKKMRRLDNEEREFILANLREQFYTFKELMNDFEHNFDSVRCIYILNDRLSNAEKKIKLVRKSILKKLKN